MERRFSLLTLVPTTELRGLVFGPTASLDFLTNVAGLATQECYDNIHDWLTAFEGVLHAEIAIPHTHGSVHIHIYFASHACAIDFKYWWDANHALTKCFRDAPKSRVGCKFAGQRPKNCLEDLAISSHSDWSDPIVQISWDANVTHPCPRLPLPCLRTRDPRAWSEWYLQHCNVHPATDGKLGVPGTHQVAWIDPAACRGRAFHTSHGASRTRR